MGNANKPKYALRGKWEKDRDKERKKERASSESSGVREVEREYGEPVRTPVALGLIIIIKPITLADFALARWCCAQWE